MSMIFPFRRREGSDYGVDLGLHFGLDGGGESKVDEGEVDAVGACFVTGEEEDE